MLNLYLKMRFCRPALIYASDSTLGEIFHLPCFLLMKSVFNVPSFETMYASIELSSESSEKLIFCKLWPYGYTYN